MDPDDSSLVKVGDSTTGDGVLLVVAERPLTLPTPRPAAPSRQPERPRRSHFWLVVTIVSLFMICVVSPLVALGFYEYEQAGKAYRGVSALGIDLSGLDRGEAEQLIGARAAELTARPVLVRAGDQQWPTDWHRLGLDMPVGPIVDRAMAVGRQGTPVDMLYAQA